MPFELALVIQTSQQAVAHHMKPKVIQPRPFAEFWPDFMFRMR